MIADPVGAAKKLTGKEIPAGLTIKVLESDPSYDFTFLLPDLVSGTMDEESLDAVVGGGDCGTFSSSGGSCSNFTGCNADRTTVTTSK